MERVRKLYKSVEKTQQMPQAVPEPEIKQSLSARFWFRRTANKHIMNK